MSNGSSRKSPTAVLLLGLIVTLVAVLVYSRYITSEITGLQEMQNDLVDRNRRESLQLLRIQDNLNSLAHTMRDMLDVREYPLTAWKSPFDRLRTDLEDAFRIQEQVAIGDQTTEQRAYVRQLMTEFWDAADRMFETAQSGDEAAAMQQIRFSLQARQTSLATAVARQLVQNNEREEAAAAEIAAVYSDVQRQVSVFLFATLTAILFTSVYMIRANRKVFAEISDLSEQRSDLARALIASQESTLRHVSRDLHDEFGQVLTAIGSMLERSRRSVEAGSPVERQLNEVREIAQSTLDNVRGMSQALHPAILEEGGLDSAIQWLVSTTDRRIGIDLSYEPLGRSFPIDATDGIHVYRVAQEALNNVVRHSGASRASIRLEFRNDALILEVRDNGRGMRKDQQAGKGLGLVGMRERAHLLGGTIDVGSPEERAGPDRGTRVRLRVPRQNFVLRDEAESPDGGVTG